MNLDDKKEIAAQHEFVPAPDGYQLGIGDTLMYETINGSWRRAPIIDADKRTVRVKVTKGQKEFPQGQLDVSWGEYHGFFAVPIAAARKHLSRWADLFTMLKELYHEQASDGDADTAEALKKAAEIIGPLAKVKHEEAKQQAKQLLHK